MSAPGRRGTSCPFWTESYGDTPVLFVSPSMTAANDFLLTSPKKMSKSQTNQEQHLFFPSWEKEDKTLKIAIGLAASFNQHTLGY